MAIRRSARTAARTVYMTGNEMAKRRHSEVAASNETMSKRSLAQRPHGSPRKSKALKIAEESKEETEAAVDAVQDTKDVSKVKDRRIAEHKWKSWSAHATSTPYPDFDHPTNHECQLAYDMLDKMHNDAIEAELQDVDMPETIPVVMDALVVAIFSQATSWNNAKRAMNSMKETYGSAFAYDKIYAGGPEKLQETIRCGGLHVRKTKIIMSLLEEVKERHGRWDLDHLLKSSDEEAMKELISYKYVGAKSAFVVLDWCLKRNRFIVDTHVYRIAGLWGWRPKEATREKTQLHLDAVIPAELKLKLHFLLIQHGRTCPACRGGAKPGHKCDVQAALKKLRTTEA